MRLIKLMTSLAAHRATHAWFFSLPLGNDLSRFALNADETSALPA